MAVAEEDRGVLALRLWGRAHGSLMDHLHRGEISEKRFHSEMLTLATQADIFVGLERAPPTATPYSSAVQALYREIVGSAVLDVVASSAKARGEPGWACQPGLLRKRVSEVLMLQRRAACLKVEVDWFYAQYHLLAGLRRSQESQEQRQERLGEFWQRFHEMGRPTKVGHREKVPSPIGGSPVTSSARSKNLSLKMDAAASAWETRGSRSRCSAGTWDWAPKGSSVLSRSQSVPAIASGSANPSSPPRTLSATFQTVPLPPIHSSQMAPQRFGLSAPIALDGFRRKGLLAAQDDDAVLTLPRHKSAFQRYWKGGLESCPSSPTLSTPGGSPTSLLLSESILSSTFSTSSLKVTGGPGRRSLLEEAKIVRPPHRAAAPTASAKPAAERYLSTCQKSGIVPSPFSFATGHTKRIDGRNKALMDLDLSALQSVVLSTGAETVDLEGNAQLTDGSLRKFIDAIVEQPKDIHIQALSLRDCSRVGQSTIEAVGRLLQTEGVNYALSQLDLSGIPMNVKLHLPLCQAIGSHLGLKSLRLSSTGLGQMPSVVDRCLDALFASQSLETLDLSWSVFGPQTFLHLGALAVASPNLQALHVANCSTAVVDALGISPVAHLIELLGMGTTLTHLDVSMNRIDFRCALALEMAFRSNLKFRRLDVSDNPLGILGTRSLLRMLCRDQCGLLHFKAQNCGSGEGSGPNTDPQVFNATKPEGRYTLDFAKPYHRALLRALYGAAERFGLATADAFTEMASQPAFDHPAAGACAALPTQGRLSFNFRVEKAYEKALLQGTGDLAFGAFVARRLEVARLAPTFRKVRPLLALFKSYEGHYQEQLVFLEALAKDFLLPYPCVAQLCRTRSLTPDILGRLLPCISGGAPARQLSLQLSTSMPDVVRILHQVHNFMIWNVENPTGHYRLDLSNAADHTVAERLAILDAWEISTKVKLGRADTSEKGNHSQVRNATYAEQDLDAKVISEWLLPEFGVLNLDYASSKRPAAGVAALDDVAWRNILGLLAKAGSQSKDTPLRAEVLVVEGRLQALRQVSHLIYITSMQLRKLLGLFASDTVRAECFVLFFNRVADMHNEKLFRARFEHPKELHSLRVRLGHASTFPFIQPEQASFTFDLAKNDQRLVANILVQVARKEKFPSNLRNPKLVQKDGAVDEMALGVPASWEALAKVPQEGVFSVSYECAPEDRAFPARRQLFETYGCWPAELEEDGVSWWSSSIDAPAPVREFLEFVISKYETVDEAWTAMESENETGKIPVKLFEEGFRKLKCRKFEGPSESTMIADIFRYLDPSGGGDISKREWAGLDRLLKDIKLSILEFVQFCDRSWPSKDQDRMTAAFRKLDADGKGTITKKEWVEVLHGAGFFGPAVPIFCFIDKDDRGAVGAAAFDALAKYRGMSESQL